MAESKVEVTKETQLIDDLLIRMDRIGDLVLTLPVDESSTFNGRKAAWFITQGLDFVVKNSRPERRFYSWTKNFSLFQLLEMVRFLKHHQVKRALVFHAPWWVSLALWWGGVSVRAGRLSQWHSFLFFNKGLRQKRSLAEKHEFAYNLDLVKHLDEKSSIDPGVHLKLHVQKAPDLLGQLSLESQDYYVIHPGMGGSALNWSHRQYAELIDILSQQHHVVVTGTRTDASVIEPIKGLLQERTNILWLNEKLNGDELIQILGHARSVVAPSTGVIHLAASTHVPTLGLYSPNRVERALRWGPRGPQVKVIEPDVQTAQDHPSSVMQKITVAQVMQSLSEFQSNHEI